MNIFDLDTPGKLLDWMSRNIEYGHPLVADTDDPAVFCASYRLQSPAQLLQSRKGVCWDQTELERCWFQYWGIKHRVLYVEVDPDVLPAAPSHTALLYQVENDWCWFENAWEAERGIKRYATFNEAEVAVYTAFAASHNIERVFSEVDGRTFGVPAVGMRCEEFMQFAGGLYLHGRD